MARGAKVSEKMLRARKMIQEANGKASVSEIAKACELTTGAITRSQWYIDYKASLPKTETRHERVKRLVLDEGKSPYAACKLVGYELSNIVRTDWYKAYKQNKGGANVE